MQSKLNKIEEGRVAEFGSGAKPVWDGEKAELDSTSASLLERLQNREDERAWQRFVTLYAPALHAWTKQLPLNRSEAEELVQEIFVLLVEKLPKLRYDPEKSFRSWLYTVSMNRWREMQRRAGARLNCADQLPEDVVTEKEGSFWRVELQQLVVSRAFDILQSDFGEQTAEAFRRYVLEGESPKSVAEDLGMTLNSVYLARHHVLRRLRQELAGLID